MDSITELAEIVADLQPIVKRGQSTEARSIRDTIIQRSEKIGKSWSGSNVGYHARVYYTGFKTPPPDEPFSFEWGLDGNYVSGGWERFDYEAVYLRAIGNIEASKISQTEAEQASNQFELKKQDLISIMELELRPEDVFLTAQLDNLKSLRIPSVNALCSVILPKSIQSRDSEAVLEGVKIAPHQHAQCFAVYLGQPFVKCQELITIAERVSKHLQRRATISNSSTAMSNKQQSVNVTNSVFIVHGHDDKAKLEIARIIDKLGLKAIILHEKASEGKTIIEKLEHHSDVSFAIVLYTPCDVGRSRGEIQENSRARQNVVFEHGYLVAKLGRKKVVAVVHHGVEFPSDTNGVVYIKAEGDWTIQLITELKNAGLPVNLEQFYS